MITTKDSELRTWAGSFITQCDTNEAAWDIPTLLEEAVSWKK
jgi:hypothetical protein